MMNYVQFAKDFLARNNAKMTITFKDVVYSPWNDRDYHNRYRIRIDRNHKTFSFDFTDSVYNREHHKHPTCYDVLACLEKYEPYTFEDFCSNYGYEVNEYDNMTNIIRINGEWYNKKNYNIYKSVKKEYNNVMRLFGDVIEELQEIN